MHNFQTILIAIGILAIIGVLIHGFITSKKEQEINLSDDYDDSSEEYEEVENDGQPYLTTVEHDEDAMAFYGATTDEKDELDSFDFSVSEQDDVIDGLDEDNKEQDIFSSTDLPNKLEEEILPAEETVEKEPQITSETNNIKQESQKEKVTEATIQEPSDIFVFNVVARDGSRLGGHELLQFFLTSGFRYGHMNIFHRHENADGTGEVLFSIANMMLPGTFDLDSMEQFQSKGISFFLTAPNDKIDIKKAFDLMLRAVIQIAEEFDCDVLNEEHGVLTEAEFIEYRSRLLKYT